MKAPGALDWREQQFKQAVINFVSDRNGAPTVQELHARLGAHSSLEAADQFDALLDALIAKGHLSFSEGVAKTSRLYPVFHELDVRGDAA